MLNIQNLPWLERFSIDQYSKICTFFKETSSFSFCENVLKPIKNHYLNERQLTSIGKQLTPDLISSKNIFIKPINVGLVSSYNVDLLKYPLITSGLRYDCLLNITLGSFNNIAQEALNPQSELNSKKLDVILILFDYHMFYQEHENQLETTNQAIDFVKKIIDGFNQKRSVTCIVQTIVSPPFVALNEHEKDLDDLSLLIDDFNLRLFTLLKNTPHHILDMARFSKIIGLENWHHPTQYYLAKLGFSQSLVPCIADKIARQIAGIHGFQKKCIVLDLDNTMWGGVVGDLGVNGIFIGQGHPSSEAFLKFQKMLLSLKKKGFLLAVCSKNDEENAKEPFISRKDMILKLDDFVVFKANWLPKSQNIKSIAQELSIALDSIIFIDDNIIEREEVRMALPNVTVPALASDPSYFPVVLLNSGLFNSNHHTTEDKNRTNLYQDNAKREQYKQNFSDLNSFYASLEMELRIYSVSDKNASRIVQLINKTNQFNLTQKRMSESEFAQWQMADNHLGICFELIDKFGNNGIIGVVLIKKEKDCYKIENFILSCRVIKRQVEHAIINFLVKLALPNVSHIQGEFRPGIRNEMVENSYQDWGFKFKSETPSGYIIWELNLEEYIKLPHSIQVKTEHNLFSVEVS